MNYLDIAVIIIIIINVGLGWFRGLIRSVANVVSIVLGFFAAKFYHDDMSLFLNQKFDLYNKIKEGLSTTFSNIELPSVNLDGISKEVISQQFGENDYMKIVADKFLESDSFQTMVDQKTLNFADGMTTWLAENIMTLLSMVVVFILVFLAVRILGHLLNQTFRLPVLKQVNKLTGFLFGLAKGLFFAMLFVLVIVVIAPFLSQYSIIESLEQSKIAIYLYRYNFIVYLFEFMM